MVEDGISVPSDLSLDKIIQFGESGHVPSVCTEMTVDGQEGLRFYNDLFKKKKMKKLLREKDPWTFSW